MGPPLKIIHHIINVKNLDNRNDVFKKRQALLILLCYLESFLDHPGWQKLHDNHHGFSLELPRPCNGAMGAN